MATKLCFEHVLFFGRTMREYEEMFGLHISEWKGCTLLDSPAGPSSFVAEANQQGVCAVGCDPIYENSLKHITSLGHRDIEAFMAQQKALPHSFDQGMNMDSELYCQKRRIALGMFLQDYPRGVASGRYFAASLPIIPYPDKSFDLVLSANFLFFYSDIASGGTSPRSSLDYEFHRRAIFELYRLCSKEVRIYPLKGPNAPEHRYFAPLMRDLAASGIDTQLKPVTYKGIAGAEHALCLIRH